MKSKIVNKKELELALNEVKVCHKGRRRGYVLRIFEKNVDPAWYNLIQDYFNNN